MEARLIYTGIRVKDLDKSIQFYTKILGMKLTGRSKIEASGGETAGLVSEDGGHLLELNYYPKGNRFQTTYATGEGLDHLAFQVDDLKKALAEAAKSRIPRRPGHEDQDEPVDLHQGPERYLHRALRKVERAGPHMPRRLSKDSAPAPRKSIVSAPPRKSKSFS